MLLTVRTVGQQWGSVRKKDVVKHISPIASFRKSRDVALLAKIVESRSNQSLQPATSLSMLIIEGQNLGRNNEPIKNSNTTTHSKKDKAGGYTA